MGCGFSRVNEVADTERLRKSSMFTNTTQGTEWSKERPGNPAVVRYRVWTHDCLGRGAYVTTALEAAKAQYELLVV